MTAAVKHDDGAEPAPCESPQEYADLGEGEHVFVVRAVDAADNRSAEVRHDWRIVPAEMTKPGLTGGPSTG